MIFLLWSSQQLLSCIRIQSVVQHPWLTEVLWLQTLTWSLINPNKFLKVFWSWGLQQLLFSLMMNWVSDDIFQSQFLLFFSQPSTSSPLPASTWRTVNHHPGLSTIIPHFLPFFFLKSQKYFISGYLWGRSLEFKQSLEFKHGMIPTSRSRIFFFFLLGISTQRSSLNILSTS